MLGQRREVCDLRKERYSNHRHGQLKLSQSVEGIPSLNISDIARRFEFSNSIVQQMLNEKYLHSFSVVDKHVQTFDAEIYDSSGYYTVECESPNRRAISPMLRLGCSLKECKIVSTVRAEQLPPSITSTSDGSSFSQLQMKM